MKFPNVFLRCAAAAICAVSLASCSGQGLLAPSAPDLNKRFQLTARVTADGSTFTADFTRTDVGEWQVTVTEPYEVQGISFTYSGGSASASFSGLTAEQLTADFSASPPALMISAFENAVQDTAPGVSYQQDALILRSGDCTVTFRQGTPAALELPGLTAEITGFSFTEEMFPGGADVVLVE